MKYIAILSVILLAGCDEFSRTSIEEFNACTKYCEDNGLTYKTHQNGAGHVYIVCVKDSIEFESKWEEE